MNKEKTLGKYPWKTWAGSQICWLWGIGELWWYNSAEVFAYKSKIDYRGEDSSVFWIEGKGDKDGVFGVSFDWGKSLDKKFIYQFQIAIQDSLPDYVLINGQRVWEKDNGIYEDQYMKFTYVPQTDSEVVKIFIVKKTSSKVSRVVFTRNPYFSPKLYCLRAGFKGERPKYAKVDLPPMDFISIDPSIASGKLEKYSDLPVDWKVSPLPKVSYPTDKINMIEAIIRTSETSLKANVLNAGFDIWYNRERGESFEKYAKTLKETGLDAMIQPLLLDEKNEYHGNHWIRFLLKGKLENAIQGTKSGIKKLLEIYPECKNVYLWYPEFNSILGSWNGGAHNSPMKGLSDEWAGIIAGNKVKALRKIFEYWNKVSSEIKKAGDGKVKIIFLNTGACPMGAYGFKCGGDIIMTKQIHRQNMNITVANARGASFAYGKEFGFDNDCWERCYIHAFHPDEVMQNLLTYFHGGGEYILNEFYVMKDKNKLTPLGKVWFEFARQAKLHPERGTQQVEIAIMRGLPDEWARACGPSTSWESANESHEVERCDYFTDYDLLNIFFSNFGNYYRTFPDRLSTGTPYGSIDFIPWDTPSKKLQNYKLIVYLGKANCMDDLQYENLKKYVEDGGVLIMAAGQLRDENGRFFKKNLSDLFGVNVKGEFTLKPEPVWDRKKMTWELPDGYKKYTRLELASPQSEVFCRLKNSDPYVVLNRMGKGKAYLFATEYLTELDEATATRVLIPECEKIKRVTFLPDSSWLEYMVQKKNGIYILPIFNHGNVGFPSGNGRKTGLWKGKISLDLSAFDFPKGKLAVYESVYLPNGKTPYKLAPIKSMLENGILSFDKEIDKFSEIIIGPSEMVEKAYWDIKLK
jgi:hypothetical protein